MIWTSQNFFNTRIKPHKPYRKSSIRTVSEIDLWVQKHFLTSDLCKRFVIFTVHWIISEQQHDQPYWQNQYVNQQAEYDARIDKADR